jgi:hypothetical protein
MKRRHSFHIELGTTSADSKVFMDGRELRGVTAVAVEAGVHGVTRVSLDLIPERVFLKVADAETVAQFQALAAESAGRVEATSIGDRFKHYREVEPPAPVVEQWSGVGEESLAAAVDHATATTPGDAA